MLRAMGLNISKDKELLSYLWHILGFPALTDETFEAVYANQQDNKQNNAGGNESDGPADDLDDSNEKLLEQNDLNYT